jgi:CubicO group peptidase (beta-lactamase class C family)
VAEFFKIPIVYQPGTKFVYTSASNFMLSAIITRTTGQTLRDYLEPRLFKPLGIRGPFPPLRHRCLPLCQKDLTFRA